MQLTIKRHTSLLLSAVTLAGVLLGLGLNSGRLKIDEAVKARSEASEMVNTFVRLNDNFRQHLLISDLILGSGETYLTLGAQEQSEHIREVLGRLDSFDLASEHRDFLSRLTIFITNDLSPFMVPA
jgi:hypothetical protein